MRSGQSQAGSSSVQALVKDRTSRLIESVLTSVGDQVSSNIERLEDIVRRVGGDVDPNNESDAPVRTGLLGQAHDLDNAVARIGYLLNEIERHV